MRSGKTWILYIIAEAVLYAAFMYIDITGGDSSLSENLKYASILLCALFTLIGAVRMKGAAAVLVAAAFVFTAGADYFLLKTSVYLPGVLCFCAVQSLYLAAVLHAGGNSESILKHLILGLPAAAAAVIAGIRLRLGAEELLLIGAAGFYAYSFVRNIVLAAMLWKKGNAVGLRAGLFTAGLIIFLLCDINVLLYNLPGYVAIDSPAIVHLITLAGDFMWMFYLPGQVMLSFSPRVRDVPE
ncbi:MAG: hypothetical protein IK001_07210 [Lachnospiraceae bacterium]|nr:hypothetical protein [Lachnospiraceae bacterium]